MKAGGKSATKNAYFTSTSKLAIVFTVANDL